jgi:hypothetical protein
MKEARFTLRPKSGAWSQDPDCRLLHFTLVASREGEPLGGNNVQARLGAPDQARYRLDRDVALWLRSGWWVSLRNQFAQVPEVATQILGSVHAELSEVTAALTTARGARTEELTHDLFARTFDAEGRDYWR